MPTPDELERRAAAEVADGSPLATLIAEHRKPKPDSAEWWQEVAQGLGVKIHELKAELKTRDEQIAQLTRAVQGNAGAAVSAASAGANQIQALREALERAATFLKFVEWGDDSSEYDASDIRHEIEQLLTRQEP